MIPVDAHGPLNGPTAGPWRDGWHCEARILASPNCNARPAGARVDLAVVHSISLPPGEYGGPWIEQLFTNTLDWSAHPYFEAIRGLEVSAHFLVRRDGALLQFVALQERAWHAGRSSWQGRTACNDYSVGIELEGLEGERFEPPQYRRLAGLLRDLGRVLPLRAVVGHEHIAAGRKLDPGPGFEWDTLRAELLGSTPGPEPGTVRGPSLAEAPGVAWADVLVGGGPA